jgi:hypothetical protein
MGNLFWDHKNLNYSNILTVYGTAIQSNRNCLILLCVSLQNKMLKTPVKDDGYLFLAQLSAKIGLALTKSTALATAIIVNVGMMTSSPGTTCEQNPKSLQ